MIGIDLGTTNCCMALQQDGAVRVIPSRTGQRTMPSIVAFTDDGSEIVGVPAQRQAVTNPNRTIFGIKRLIGRKHEAREVKQWEKLVPFELCAAKNGDAWVRTRDHEYSPQELSAMLLQELKSCAEAYLGEEVTDAVVTVPAYYNDAQRQATKDAAAIAGLRVRHILNEPTAAALGYGIDKRKDQTLAIFDLGGDDFDRALTEYLLADFEKKNQIDLSEDPVALQRVREAAENAKRELSSTPTTGVNLPFICTGPMGPLHMQHDVLERSLLERLTEDLLERLVAPCQRALADAKLKPEQLDQVLLVGGMTRMPAVQRKVKGIFGKLAAKDVNPDEIVAIGAATQCAIMSGEIADAVLLDVTPHSLGVRVKEGRMSPLIAKNTTIPTSERKLFTTTRDDQDFVEILVYQGEQTLADHNAFLGRVILDELPRKPAGNVHVEVTFLIDADGVVNVDAREVTTDKKASVRISPSSGLSRSQVDAIASDRKRAAG